MPGKLLHACICLYTANNVRLKTRVQERKGTARMHALNKPHFIIAHQRVTSGQLACMPQTDRYSPCACLRSSSAYVQPPAALPPATLRRTQSAIQSPLDQRRSLQPHTPDHVCLHTRRSGPAPPLQTASHTEPGRQGTTQANQAMHAPTGKQDRAKGHRNVRTSKKQQTQVPLSVCLPYPKGPPPVRHFPTIVTLTTTRNDVDTHSPFHRTVLITTRRG